MKVSSEQKLVAVLIAQNVTVYPVKQAFDKSQWKSNYFKSLTYTLVNCE